MKLQRATWCVVYCVIGVARAADQGGYSGHDNYEYSPYHYEYNVDDDKEYLHFGQEEEDDGTGNVHGHYHVQLPDGRLQRVEYHINGYSGYIADVKYDGEAHHPTQSHHVGHGDLGYHSLGHSHHVGHGDLGHHSLGHFGGSGRLGKAVIAEPVNVEAAKPIVQSVQQGSGLRHGNFGQHSSGFFGGSGRLGKAVLAKPVHFEAAKPIVQSVHQVNEPSQESFGQHSSEFFGGSSRFGKSQSIEPKPIEKSKPDKKAKSNLITRKRLDKSETFAASSSEQVNTIKSPKTFFNVASAVPVKVRAEKKVAPQTKFQFRDSRNRVQTFKQVHQEVDDLKNGQQTIESLERFPKQLQSLQDNQRHIQDLHRVQQEVQGIQNAQRHIQRIHRVQQETQGLQNAQRQIQNIQQVQREQETFQKTQKEVPQVKSPGTQNGHRRFPSLIKHDFFESKFASTPHSVDETASTQQASPKTSQSQFHRNQGGFPQVIKGRVIQTP